MQAKLPKIAISFVFAASAIGCESLRPDQERVQEALFWTHAQVETEPAPDPDAEMVQIADGASTVLMSNEGYSHGRRSTAHASHHAVFMTLPADISEGRTYRLSRADSTLHYDAFAGYNFWYIDPEQPAWAQVEIKSVSDDAVKAVVQIELTGVCGAQGTPLAQRPRTPISRDQTMIFRRTEKTK